MAVLEGFFREAWLLTVFTGEEHFSAEREPAFSGSAEGEKAAADQIPCLAWILFARVVTLNARCLSAPNCFLFVSPGNPCGADALE